MTARTTIYGAVGGYQEAGSTIGDETFLCVVEGTEEEIQEVFPQGKAFGWPTDADTLWRYSPTTRKWTQIIATTSAHI